MSWRKLLDEGKIQRKRVSIKEVNRVFLKAQRTLKSAEFLLEKYEEIAFKLAYEAMLIAGRALIFSLGFRPRSAGSHKTTIEFCDSFLSKDYKLLIEKFDLARKKRHYLIYGTGMVISLTEARGLIKTAKEFLKIVEKTIVKQRKQKKLI